MREGVRKGDALHLRWSTMSLTIERFSSGSFCYLPKSTLFQQAPNKSNHREGSYHIGCVVMGDGCPRTDEGGKGGVDR